MAKGWMDVCLNVQDVANSRAYYEDLGFHRVEGDDAEGWALMVMDEARIGLFAPEFMDGRAFTLNFRGGDVEATVHSMRRWKGAVAKPLARTRSGAETATLIDPDGHVLYFENVPGEVKLK